jgi:enoyl-CoA hydratase
VEVRVSDELLTEVRGGVLVVTLNRPAQKNALNGAVMYGISEAMHRLETDDSLVVAVVTGAGGTFCSGMDLKEFVSGGSTAPKSEPVIAAVEGYALAGGCETALACDIIVAGRDSKFGIPEVKRGLVAAGGGLYRMPKVMSYQNAALLALTGDIISAEQAKEMGMVTVLTETGNALDAAMEIAEKIAANGPLAVRATKEVLAASARYTDAEFMAWQQTVVGPVFASEDAREGATAFAEKRAPQWKSR